MINDDEPPGNEQEGASNSDGDDETLLAANSWSEVHPNSGDIQVEEAATHQLPFAEVNEIKEFKSDDLLFGYPTLSMLAWHYCLQHTSFQKMRMLSARGELPNEFMSCRIPKCAACIYRKATKQTWHTKGKLEPMRTPPVKGP